MLDGGVSSLICLIVSFSYFTFSTGKQWVDAHKMMPYKEFGKIFGDKLNFFTTRFLQIFFHVVS